MATSLALALVTASATLAYNIQDEVWSSSHVADQLFLEMCEHGPMVDDPAASNRFEQINKYYLQAAKYAGRISAGDFSDAATPRPVFELDAADFTATLRAYLILAKKDGMLNDIVREAAFKLFRARHKMIFFQYIESEKLKFQWEFVA
jgi:hypothetical protein